ncbi:MAG: molybdopterin molybdotransferase MoeA [Flavobacteriales bacterium]|nr:molybdopterin molybdotransferase MoeA [Flavobacteriales bacterium]
MISVEKAKELISENVKVSKTIVLPLNTAINFYLAKDIISPVDVPLFNQSAMDGYAFKYSDKEITLTLVGEIAAGDTHVVEVQNGEAVRIFTGSKIPDSCDVVVMQELTEIVNEKLIVKDFGLKPSGNIRKKGNQLKSGDVALKKGTQINPAAVGFLSTLGISTVEVYASPKVTVIATGSELQPVGTHLKEGQIYESNSQMLEAALKNLGINSTVIVVQDNEKSIEKTIRAAITDSDVVLITGGISVGDYDFVKQCLISNQVVEIFHKIKQKPGKPMYFGTKQNTLVFALPGNPAAALSCFYNYVFPAIRIMLGNLNPFLPNLKLQLDETFIKKEGRAVFLKAVINQNKVTLLKGQDSDALQSFAMANAIAYIPAEKQSVLAGELIDVYLLPQYIQ